MAFPRFFTKPVFVMRFGLYFLFLVLASYIYFSDIMSNKEDKTIKILFCGALFFYGCFRLVLTWQQYKQALREEDDDKEHN